MMPMVFYLGDATRVAAREAVARVSGNGHVVVSVGVRWPVDGLGVAGRHGDDPLVTREVVRRESKRDYLLPVVAERQPDHGRGARDQRGGDGRHLPGVLAGRDNRARER